MISRPRNSPEAAQYPLPLAEPSQLDLFGFATARAMGNTKTRNAPGDRDLSEGSSSFRPLDPVFELVDDPWSSEYFVDGPAYAEVKKVLADWRAWPRPAMALIGSHGCGKTHLGRIWAHDIGGRFETSQNLAELTADVSAAMASGPLVVDMADIDVAPLQLFSIFNAAYGGGGPVVFIGNAAPASWPSSSTDLLSRFSSLTSVKVRQPDDEYLAKILQSLCRKRFIRLEDTVASGLITRSAQAFEALGPLADGIERLVQVDALEPSLRVLDRILTYARLTNSQCGGGADEDRLRD